ncbi:hypothetical protein K470DRAFT_276483 [Piedraia hortae CBS 480.64]|uniref:Uncharacterized protein n=1 Tax=Piedraia hortae CBS 480.64 TaxID=1314780 RepID=A0A6A7C169_9PEZI|nr:hypothetical protein K470DRAFT_276483 [Piedraia hortae CBS 480.64]
MLPRNGVTRIGSEITAQGAPSTYRGSISNQELVGAATVATQWPGTQTALAQAQIDMFPSPSPAKGLPTYSQPLQTQASTPGPQRMSSTSMTPQPVFPSTQAVMNNLWTPWSGNRNTFVRSPYTANQSSTRSPLVQTRHSTNSPTQHQTSPSPSPQQQQQTQQPAQEPQPQQSARTTLSPAEATTIEVKDDHHNEEDDCVVCGDVVFQLEARSCLRPKRTAKAC